jgi:hypothetical protein
MISAERLQVNMQGNLVSLPIACHKQFVAVRVNILQPGAYLGKATIGVGCT